MNFLQSPCESTASSIVIQIGKFTSHCTHRLHLYGGVHLCTSCGATSTTKLSLLRKPCLGKLSKPSTFRNIAYFTQGKSIPNFGANWPYRCILQPFKKTCSTLLPEEKVALANVIREVNRIRLEQQEHALQNTDTNTSSDDNLSDLELDFCS